MDEMQSDNIMRQQIIKPVRINKFVAVHRNNQKQLKNLKLKTGRIVESKGTDGNGRQSSSK